MELNKEILENSKQLGYELKETTEHEYDSAARSIGYEPLGYYNIYDDKSEGILVQLPAGQNKYNNGTYMYHKNNDGQIVLEVVVPNTANKGDLIRHLVGEISTFVENLDTSDLDTYDFAEIYGFVIANTVVKHLASSLFPEDKKSQQHFTMIYMSRFLAHIAQIHAGDKNIREEAVNSDPYLFKMAMQGIPELDAQIEEHVKELQKANEDEDN
jgi:hypothetical protein